MNADARQFSTEAPRQAISVAYFPRFSPTRIGVAPRVTGAACRVLYDNASSEVFDITVNEYRVATAPLRIHNRGHV